MSCHWRIRSMYSSWAFHLNTAIHVLMILVKTHILRIPCSILVIVSKLVLWWRVELSIILVIIVHVLIDQVWIKGLPLDLKLWMAESYLRRKLIGVLTLVVIIVVLVIKALLINGVSSPVRSAVVILINRHWVHAGLAILTNSQAALVVTCISILIVGLTSRNLLIKDVYLDSIALHVHRVLSLFFSTFHNLL